MQSNAIPGFRGVLSRLALAMSAALAAPAGVTAQSVWLDLEGRIQYGFYIEDVRALAGIADELSRGEGEQGSLQHYYAGLANYRLGSLLAGRDKERARTAIERCVGDLDAALEAQSELAAALALQAACLRTLSALKPWRALAGSKGVVQLERAVKLAPRDPRVLLIEALTKSADGKLDDAALATLQRATAAFESERQGIERTPGWGAAEAYAYLGRGYLERGDVLNARDALERALLIAPDFAFARRLLMKITSG